VDVTEDPLGLTEPGLVPVIFRIEWTPWGSEGGVVGFTGVPIASHEFKVRALAWVRMQDDIDVMEKNFNIEDNWWMD